MPLFEYRCTQCQHQFELIVNGSTTPACPSCRSERLEKKISAFAVGATGWAPSSGGACGSCGDPRGSGACSMN
ncbi:MAG TPA: zinc ribbon domain-containing protein [Nitrospiraceae bacterium]|nr:zinc ribbon domain-containing protein [Nitrospiraceae bacterium]